MKRALRSSLWMQVLPFSHFGHSNTLGTLKPSPSADSAPLGLSQ